MASEPTALVVGLPCWSREASIGDYGGDPDKVPSETEGVTPYAWYVYRELSAMRGSAYSGQLGGTIVHCEHLAIARMLAWCYWRLPEQFVANCLPGTADYALPYWAEVLGVPARASDQAWQIRQRCAAHYRATTELTLQSIQAALSDLLGDVYVDATFQTGSSLSSPPLLTYWPGVNPGPASRSLGGGCWASERSHLYVEVERVAGMSDSDYRQLINVQLFQLLDRMLPAYCTFAAAEGGGFLLDISQLDFQGLTPS